MRDTPDAEVRKLAATALVRQIAKGLLSPQAINRAAKAMPPGSVRQIKPLGSGSFNVADLMVGNVGDQAGLVVRKLPRKLVNTRLNARVHQLASREVERIQPGAAAKYLPGDGSKGLFQEYGTKPVVPGWSPQAPATTYLDSKHAPHAEALEIFKPLLDKGVRDIRPANLGPFGQLIDYQKRVGKTRRHLAGGTVPSPGPNGGRELAYSPAANQWIQGQTHKPLDFDAREALENNFIRRYWLSPNRPDLGFPNAAPAPARPPLAPSLKGRLMDILKTLKVKLRPDG